MPSCGNRFDAAEIAHAAAAVMGGVAVEDLLPPTGVRDADAEIGARDGGEVEHGHEGFGVFNSVAEPAEGAALGVVAVDPGESGGVGVAFVKSRLIAVETVEVGERFLEAVRAFRSANEINPSWKIEFNIGQCEAALKRYGLAMEAFEKYLALGGDEVPTDGPMPRVCER